MSREQGPEPGMYLHQVQELRQQQEMHMRPVEILDQLDAEKVTMLRNRIKERVFSGAINKKTFVNLVGATADSKSGLYSQLREAWDYDEDVAQNEQHHDVTVSHYHIKYGDGLAYGRKRSLITSPAGQITPTEYSFGSQVISGFLDLARRYLPDPAVITVETVAQTAYKDDEGNLVGVDRGWSVASDLIANHGAITAAIVAPDAVSERELDRREKINATEAQDVKQTQEQTGVLDDREDPYAIKQFYQHTGDRATRMQQDADINANMWRLVAENKMGQPDFRIADAASFNDTRDERAMYVENVYFPWWMRNIYGTQSDPEDAFVFWNTPLPEGQDVHVYGKRFEEENLVDALIQEARKTNNPLLRGALENLGVTL